MAPRTRLPVLSFDTHPGQQHELKAEIKAALPQQKLAKKRRLRSQSQTTQNVQLSHDVNWQCACQSCLQSKLHAERTANPFQHHSLLPSRRTIGGTVKGELMTAKDYLKNTSKKQLERFRTRKSNAVATPSKIDDFLPPKAGYAELSGSQPHIVHQLDDGETQTDYLESSRQSLPPAYDDERRTLDLSPVSPLSSYEICAPLKLQSKSCTCNNCSKDIAGDDLYDFCERCPAESRLLCKLCARQGGCSRHRPDDNSKQMPSGLRGSPAPSYNERSDFRIRGHSKLTSNEVASPECNNSESIDKDTTLQQPKHYTPISTAALKSTGSGSVTEGGPKVTSPLVQDAQVQQMLRDEIRTLLKREQIDTHTAEVSMLARETTLREQQAVFREQRMTNRELSIREQELSLREQITQSRDRDAMLIQGLQNWATVLARSLQIGAQFQTSKSDGFEDNNPVNLVSRSASASSNASGISLHHDKHGHAPKETISQAVADAEATFGSMEISDAHIRSHAEKRKKGGASNIANTSTPEGNSKGGSNQTSQDDKDGSGENYDDSEDESSPTKKQKQTSSKSAMTPRLLACPYCKHDRDRYSPKNRNQSEKLYRGCAGRDLPDIPRLKQHLRRVHWRPINHCLRCWTDCQTPNGLAEHHDQDERCEKKICPFPEKMDKQQQDKIHVKRPRVDQVQQWYEIYSVLFPESRLPESPYADDDDFVSPPISATPSTATHDEATQKLGRLFNRRLEEYKDQLSPQVVDLVKQVLDECVAETFTELSIASSPSPCQQAPITPTIVVSPVDTRSETRPRATTHGLSSPNDESPTRKKQKPKSQIKFCKQTVPRLGDPTKLELRPVLPGQAPRAVSRRQPEIINTNPPSEELAMPATRSVEDVKQVARNRDPRTYMDQSRSNPLRNSDIGEQHLIPAQEESGSVSFPSIHPHVSEDTGYDGECYSYESGDDRFAMINVQQPLTKNRRRVNPDTLQLPQSPRLRREPKLSIETLKDLPAQYFENTEQLQHNKSVVSKIDSGYGSSNSEHPGSRRPISHDDYEDEVMTDTDYPAGHETFDDQLRTWTDMQSYDYTL